MKEFKRRFEAFVGLVHEWPNQNKNNSQNEIQLLSSVTKKSTHVSSDGFVLLFEPFISSEDMRSRQGANMCLFVCDSASLISKDRHGHQRSVTETMRYLSLSGHQQTSCPDCRAQCSPSHHSMFGWSGWRLTTIPIDAFIGIVRLLLSSCWPSTRWIS